MKAECWVVYVRSGFKKDGKWWPMEWIGFARGRNTITARYNNWAMNTPGWPKYKLGSRRGFLKAVKVCIETVEELPE